MSKWKSGDLHSGSKKGPKVTSRKQALAIMLSEKREAKGGKREYESRAAIKGLKNAKFKSKEKDK